MSMLKSTTKSCGATQSHSTPGNRDPLTGLFNYDYFIKQAALLEIEQKFPLSVIICDINGLALIGDTFGQSKKDELLINASKLISSCVRRGDCVAKGESEYFLVLLPETSAAVAGIIMDRIQSKCRIIIGNTGENLLCLSTGCATKTGQREDITEVIAEAKKDMHAQWLGGQKYFYSSLLQPIKNALHDKSHETEEHSKRLVRQSRMLGEALKLPEEQLVKLELLAMLHDIGKVGIDENILKKPGPLSAREWSEIKKHPKTGYRIAKAIPQLSGIAREILCHHERWDGKGYPKGLKRESIPLLSRIIAVVDAFDALTSGRCYREPVAVNEALCEIERCAGTQFDPEIANKFVYIMRRGSMC